MKIADTIRTMGCDEPDPPTLYCQSNEDEFGWVQLTCGKSEQAPAGTEKWVVTFGLSLLKSDDEVNRLAFETLQQARYTLQRSSVSSTITLIDNIRPDDLADFVVRLMANNSTLLDLGRVEVVLEYRYTTK